MNNDQLEKLNQNLNSISWQLKRIADALTDNQKKEPEMNMEEFLESLKLKKQKK